MDTHSQGADEWLAEQLSEDDVEPHAEPEEEPQAVNLDVDPDQAMSGVEPGPDTEPDDEQPGGLSGKAKLIGAMVAAAVIVAAGSAVFYTAGGPDRAVTSRQVADPVAKPAAAGPPAVGPQTDRPLPYTADAAGSCPAGSTSAQTM